MFYRLLQFPVTDEGNDTYPCNCLANFRIVIEVIYKQTITSGYMNKEKRIGMWQVRLASIFGGTSKDGGAFEDLNPIDCC